MIHKHTIKITPISSIDLALQKTLVIEILSVADITKSLSAFGKEYKERAIDNFKTKNDREKTLNFHMLQGKFETITLFFPDNEQLMEERSSFFRALTKNIVYIPSTDEV